MELSKNRLSGLPAMTLIALGLSALMLPAQGRTTATDRDAAIRVAVAVPFGAGGLPHGRATPDYPRPFVSNATRAEIRAEALEAVQEDQMERGRATPDYPDRFTSQETRADVKAQALQAKRLGLIPRGDGPYPLDKFRRM